MRNIISQLRQKAKSNRKRIVLPEGEDTRVLAAADYINREKLADLIILGSKKKIEGLSKDRGFNLAGVNIIEPASCAYLGDFSSKLYQLLKHKGTTEEEAKNTLIEKSVYFGAMLVREGKADGFVGGATHTTRDVARAALYCIGLDPEVGTMSSSFLMILEDESFGEKGVLVFADCAIIPDPSPKQLASIAISANDLAQSLFAPTPRVALLSFSTKGSASSPQSEKVLKALDIIKQIRPDLLVDGELQADAALVLEVADIKAPGSPLGGKANVLIFPNLEAGNISYKLTHRLAKARALGPLLQGVLAPCSDLSRGCDAEDIIDVVCVTAIRCAYTKTK